MAFRRSRRNSANEPARHSSKQPEKRAAEPAPPPPTNQPASADSANLDDKEHAWWAQRDELDRGVPKGRRRRDAKPVVDLDDPWSIDKLFDFVPNYDLKVDETIEVDFDPTVPFERPDDPFSPPTSSAADGLFRADDPYAVIGVPSTATWEEITEAHRNLARLHHPDRLVDASEEARVKSEERMREVNIAYSELRRRRGR